MTSITFDEMTTLTFDVEPSEVKTMAFDDPIVAGLHSVIQKLTLKIVEVRDDLIRNLACLSTSSQQHPLSTPLTAIRTANGQTGGCCASATGQRAPEEGDG